jgi:hypothetical protein
VCPADSLKYATMASSDAGSARATTQQMVHAAQRASHTRRQRALVWQWLTDVPGKNAFK